MPDLPLQHLITRDGSSTLYAPKFQQHYHSIHGALQESLHVFVEAGLRSIPEELTSLYVLEMGLGTGLNALLTHKYAGNRIISYVGIEAYPITKTQWQQLNYPEFVSSPSEINALHEAPWGQWVSIFPQFRLYKHLGLLEDYQTTERFHLVYFDAFAPDAQPELWTAEIMAKIYHHCLPGAVFVTYSAKGSVRRALQSVGFQVEKIPGPPGKREMLRGTKPRDLTNKTSRSKI